MKWKTFLNAHKLLTQPVLSGREAAPESRCSLLVFSTARLKRSAVPPSGLLIVKRWMFSDWGTKEFLNPFFLQLEGSDVKSLFRREGG